MPRPKEFVDEVVISIHMERSLLELVQEVASAESSYTGKRVAATQLMRHAVKYVFDDNERMREAFRRSRWCAWARREKT